MNIKEFDKYKKVALHFIDTFPLEGMEFDIQQNSDPLIRDLYNSLIETEREIISFREKNIIHKIGICMIYSLFDSVYYDPFHNILLKVKNFNLEPKNSKDWRINKNGERND